MGTLASELGAFAEELTDRPRFYADANVPAGLVALMRQQLGWDVLFVLEHEDLRRARDAEHFRLAAQLRRTLLTLDRDYLDERRFPPGEGSGVLVLTAPDEEQLTRLLRRLDRAFFKKGNGPDGPASTDPPRLPLAGRTVHVHTDWTEETD
jgi:predicted nuclease of predicted toxin-antitoxin system